MSGLRKPVPVTVDPAAERLPFVSSDAIRSLVGQSSYQAGIRYWRGGRVASVALSQDGRNIISGTVRGSQPAPYHQTIQLAVAGADVTVVAAGCSCPLHRNCKHVAAVLLACQAKAGVLQRPQAEAPRALAGPAPSRPAEAPLPPEVEAWLRSLEKSQVEETDDYPPNIRKRLLYVIERNAQTGSAAVSLASIEMGRDGNVSSNSARRHWPHEFERASQPPKYLRPVDWDILPELMRLATRVGATLSSALLRRILATGRARWATWDGPTLAEAPPVAGRLGWTLEDDGRQQPRLEIGAGLQVLALAEPWYVDPRSGAIGPVHSEQPPRLLRAMLACPPVTPDLAARLRTEMQRRLPQAEVPAPRALAPPRRLRETLQPHLTLLAGSFASHPWAPAAAHRGCPDHPGQPMPLARLAFQYGPVTLATPVRRDTVQHNGELLTILRDPGGEARAWERLHQLGLQVVHRLGFGLAAHPHAHDLVLSDPDTSGWIDFMLHDVPALRADGWRVEIAEDFPLRLAEPEGDVTVTINEGSGIDWFDLELGVMVDGERINLIPMLRELLSGPDLAGLLDGDGEPDDALPALLPLPDGRLLTLPLSRLRPILAPLLELFQDSAGAQDEGALRLSRHRAADVALLEDAGASLAWSGGEALRALGRHLRASGGIAPARAPEGFAAELRPYQAQGLGWLQFLAAAGLGGVLADDMGLGKTVQTLAHLATEQAQGRLDRPALVVCPTSVVPTWRAEAARFAPTLRTLVLHGPDRGRHFPAIARHDLVITSYPLLARDHTVLAAQDWHVVVLDEAQTIKNPAATTSKLARSLNARLRLCLSGTPLENHLGELWSLFDFLMPGFLGDRQSFARRYRGPIEKTGNEERRALLARRVAPFLLRRTKAAVATDLPPRSVIGETVEMEPPQRAVYESIRLAMHKRVRDAIAERGLARSGIIILDALLKLRQACCDPRLLKLDSVKSARAGSAKLERLLEMLPQMLEEGRRILLFSQFTSMLALIEAELAARGMPYLLLTGETRDRASLVERFQAREVPLFLISLKAGGVGLTLTAADTVIHYDPWWNPAVEDQATDRAHRIGQDKPVFVHKLITLGTIEEKMETLKARKQALVDGILGADSGATLSVTEADVEALFSE